MMSQLLLILSWLFVPLFLCNGEQRLFLSQTPRWEVKQLGDTAKMNCHQIGIDHSWMYWYRQPAAGGDLEFIGILVRGTPEPSFEDRFKGGRFRMGSEDKKHCSLQISELRPEDAARVDFDNHLSAQLLQESVPEGISFWRPCSRNTLRGKVWAILPSLVTQCSNNILYFGKGTRLTVLGVDQDVSPPQVTVFAPPKQEVDEKEKATIVCLVTDFFPDHVALSWTVNNEKRTAGVKTEDPVYDNTAKRYSMTSRLRITKEEWQNADNKFVCRVSFHDTEGSTDYEDDINGADCGGGSEAARESYLTQAYLGELVYILLILKSTLYGAFVMGLKLRKKLAP
ncbi:T cell receptor beta [Podarcis lilfordi]|nr:T cell receptor beta [Podarcis lilfordi]